MNGMAAVRTHHTLAVRTYHTLAVRTYHTLGSAYLPHPGTEQHGLRETWLMTEPGDRPMTLEGSACMLKAIHGDLVD